MVFMYGVSGLIQNITYEVGVYDEDTSSVIPSGVILTQPISMVGGGNRVDITAIDNPALLLSRATFIYQSVWNFQSAWQWTNDTDSFPLFPQFPRFMQD